MTEIIAFLVEHWGTIATVVGGLLAVASVVTGLTKTTKDDAVVAWIRKAFEFFSVLAPKDAPGTLKAPGTFAERPLLTERTEGAERPKVTRLDR